jgi:predicted enzyme related to lactoylglutathione lyase
MQTTGTLVHFSIPAADVSEAVEFYGKLFGWKFQKMTDTYYLAEGGVGSISLEKEPVSGTMPILYFSVSNLDLGLELVEKLGGKIVLQKTDAGDGKSFFATFADKNGNIIGLWSKA